MKQKDITKISSSDHAEVDELSEAWWRFALIRRPGTKRAISIRLDEDVIKWFKSEAPQGYQSYMNGVLRTYMEEVVRYRKTHPSSKSSTSITAN